MEKKCDPETGKPFLIRDLTLRGKTYKFSQKQSEFISNFDGLNNKFLLHSGGRGSGKSLALCVKMYIMCKGFKGITIVLGRKNISDIEKTTLQDLFRLIPPMEYEHRVKDGKIIFKNGSTIILMGLDAMQSGNVGDMKKAQQKTKSMNIGAYFIDQLEEIEYEVFQAINDTMRMVSPEMSAFLLDAPEHIKEAALQMEPSDIQKYFGVLDYPRQGNMTCNPANFWAYHYFKLSERMNEDGHWIPKTTPDTLLLESSMLDNKANLPVDFVRDRLSREESYVRRMVHGEWNLDVLLKGSVFAREHISHLEKMVKPPISIEEGCEIYEMPKSQDYRMGVDPSEGVVDPSSISVVSQEGKKVASFNGMIPIQGLADKVKFLYYKFNKPTVVIESNSGAALIREVRDLKLYYRKMTDEKYDKTSEKLGFRMSWESKALLIDHFQKLLRQNAVKLYDRRTVEEMKTFLWSDEATQSGAGASRGFHDDNIISTLLAYWDWNPRKTELALARKAQPVHVKRFQYN
jgi:hypothetical protein